MNRRAVSHDEDLRTSADRQVSFRLPDAIDHRLDALVARATDAGERTNRRELLAAILLRSDRSGEDLGEDLRAFRRAKVRDALFDADDTSNVVEFERHRPGPRAVGS